MILADVGIADGIGIDDVFWLAAGIATLLGVLRLIFGKAISRLSTFLDWSEKFQRDWEGEEEAPGRDRVPGVMERLNAIDGELKRNGGASLKDQVCDTRRAVDWLIEQVGVVETRQRNIQNQLEVHSQTLDSHINTSSVS